MASTTKTPPPPLYTADGVAMEIDMLVYGVDTNCRHATMPIIEPLKVTAFDLGVARSVRLRCERGTEWTWSATSKSDTCNTADQFIYHSYDAAKAAVATVLAPLREEHAETLRDRQEDLKYLEDDYRESLKNTQKEVDEAAKVLEDFDKQVTKLTNSKAPSNPFEKPAVPEAPVAKKKSTRAPKKITRKRRASRK